MFIYIEVYAILVGNNPLDGSIKVGEEGGKGGKIQNTWRWTSLLQGGAELREGENEDTHRACGSTYP